jgi:hypothetical protein
LLRFDEHKRKMCGGESVGKERDAKYVQMNEKDGAYKNWCALLDRFDSLAGRALSWYHRSSCQTIRKPDFEQMWIIPPQSASKAPQRQRYASDNQM